MNTACPLLDFGILVIKPRFTQYQAQGLAGLSQLAQINTRLKPQFFKSFDDTLSFDIAFGAWSIRATTDAAGGGIEGAQP